MADRLTNWVDRDTQEREAELDILYDQAVSIDVFRINDDGTNPGVVEEVDDASFLRTINVRLDPTPDKRTQHAFLGMTDDPDVQIQDKWRWTPPRGSAIFLEVKVSLYKPSGNSVELDYA